MPAKGQPLANTLMAFDELYYDPVDLSMKPGLIAATYPDDSARDAANNEGEKLSVYLNNLFLKKAYKVLKTIFL